jgi:hypothetical protein
MDFHCVDEPLFAKNYLLHSKKNYSAGSKDISLRSLSHIGNADETPVYFDMPDNTTREVKLITTGYEKQRITVMLTITTDGFKLPPFIILKRKTFPKKEIFPRDVVVRTHVKGWMSSELMVAWIDTVWKRRPGSYRSPRGLFGARRLQRPSY